MTQEDRNKYPKGTKDQDIAFEKEFRKKHPDNGYRLATKEDTEDME